MKRLLIPAAMTVIMLAALVSLGVWQLERRAWKADLLARIDAAEAQPAIALSSAPDPFSKVRLEGYLRTDRLVRYGAEVRGNTLGAQIIVPMERPGADPVLVDLGWAPNDAARPLTFPQGAIEGFVRPPEHAGYFSGKDDPSRLLFYTLDPATIGAALGLAHTAPFTLVAIGTAPPGIFPEPVLLLPRPTDNHLQYAATWFGFALTLLVIFTLYSRKTLRP